MSDAPISGLADLATLADDDELPVLDLSASETKAVTVANLRTAVAPAAASATVSGIVELATTAEVITGTDTVRAVTPAGLAAKVAGAASGYSRTFLLMGG